MEEYLKTVLEQIRCKKAQWEIREELLAHMTDQKEANMAKGMTEEEAEKCAVADMGDPVETGIALDKVHRPQAAWQMITVMAVISAASMLIHWRIGSPRMGVYILTGFVLMLLIYHLDYTRIAGAAKPLAILFLVICAGIFSQIFGLRYAGNIWIAVLPGFGGIGMFQAMMLYVPLYGAVLYQYYGTGYRGLLKGILWALPPLLFALWMPSLTLFGILYVSMCSLLLLAVAKGWFRVSKNDCIYLIVTAMVLIPVLFLVVAWLRGQVAPYQMDRIRAFLNRDVEWNYVTNNMRKLLMESSFFGTSAANISEILPDYNNSWILIYLAASYGQVAFLLVCVGLVFLLCKVFGAVLGQKNQLGMMMGFGCGMILLLNVLLNISETLGLLPVSQTFLPFFSQGGSGIMLCYILMGIIMSVYRYQDIYSCHVKAHQGRKLKIRVELTE